MSGWPNWATQQRGGLLDRESENNRADDGTGVDAVATKRLGRVGRNRPVPRAAVLTLWSMLQYLNAARGDLLDQ